MEMTFESIGKAILQAALSKNFGLLAVLVLWAMVMGIRTYGGKIPFLGPILSKPLAGPLLATVLSLVGYVGTAMMSGQPISIGALGAVLFNGLAASGFHELLQKTKEAATKKGGEITNVIEADKFFKRPEL